MPNNPILPRPLPRLVSRRSVVDTLERRLAFSYASALTPTDDIAYDAPSPAVAFKGSVWFTAGRLQSHALYKSDGTVGGTASTAATLPMLQDAGFGG